MTGIRRAGATVAVMLALGTALAGCGVPDFEIHPTPSPTPGNSAASENPFLTPTAAEPSAPSPTDLGVRTGAATGDPDIDVAVRVAYRNGQVMPPAGNVDVQKGTRVKVTVLSDRRGYITVAYHPGRPVVVPAGGQASVTFDANERKVINVHLEDVGVLLVSFRVV